MYVLLFSMGALASTLVVLAAVNGDWSTTVLAAVIALMIAWTVQVERENDRLRARMDRMSRAWKDLVSGNRPETETMWVLHPRKENDHDDDD